MSREISEFCKFNRGRVFLRRFILLTVASWLAIFGSSSSKVHSQGVVPNLIGDWWQVAGNPNVDPYTSAQQQPVDFGIWQAADGTWQIWSCIRNTNIPALTRLFHGWEGADLFDTNWTPQGISMLAEQSLGEVPGGLQAPHLVKENGTYQMLYGTWDHIARATSQDGKNFTKVIQNNGKTSLFGLGEINPRDTMTIKVDNLYYTYYTTRDIEQGRVFLRTSTDLNTFSERQEVAFGGSAGEGWTAAECPFVYYHEDSGDYFLFRTQKYSTNPETRVYRSSDPTYFGIGEDADDYLIAQLPVAAPELVEHNGKLYMAALNTGLDGIRISELSFFDPTMPTSFLNGGLWDIEQRRMNLAASGSFQIGDIDDASALLDLDLTDPRIAELSTVQSETINFNNPSGQSGRFNGDASFLLEDNNHTAMRANGSFYLEESGTVTFGLTVNDGAMLSVNGEVLILDDQPSGVADHFGSIALDAGMHDLELVYFQHEFSAVLELYAANNFGQYDEFQGNGSPMSGWQLLQASVVGLEGDYNGNGVVDAADYSVWLSYLGSDQVMPNDSTPGSVSSDDYVVWKANFGMSLSGNSQNSGHAIPEPLAHSLLLIGLMSSYCGKRALR